MGGCLCTLRHPTSAEKSNSVAVTDGRGPSLSDYVRSKKDMDVEAAKSEKKVLTLEDWMKPSSPSSNKHSKKKVHPCFNQSQLRRSLISEAQDSLYLDRTMKQHQQENEESSSVRSLSCKSQKRVSFKLPHVVIFYNPDEPSCKKASLSSSEDTDCITEDSFVSPNFGANLFDSTEEPVRLAVETFPRVFVSSRISHLCQ